MFVIVPGTKMRAERGTKTRPVNDKKTKTAVVLFLSGLTVGMGDNIGR